MLFTLPDRSGDSPVSAVIEILITFAEFQCTLRTDHQMFFSFGYQRLHILAVIRFRERIEEATFVREDKQFYKIQMVCHLFPLLRIHYNYNDSGSESVDANHI